MQKIFEALRRLTSDKSYFFELTSSGDHQLNRVLFPATVSEYKAFPLYTQNKDELNKNRLFASII